MSAFKSELDKFFSSICMSIGGVCACKIKYESPEYVCLIRMIRAMLCYVGTFANQLASNNSILQSQIFIINIY